MMGHTLRALVLTAALIFLSPAAKAATFACTTAQNEPTADQQFTIPAGEMNINVPVTYRATFTFTITDAQPNESFLVFGQQYILMSPQPSDPSGVKASWTSSGQGDIVTCDNQGRYESGNVALQNTHNEIQGVYNTKATFDVYDVNNPMQHRAYQASAVRSFTVVKAQQ